MLLDGLLGADCENPEEVGGRLIVIRSCCLLVKSGHNGDAEVGEPACRGGNDILEVVLVLVSSSVDLPDGKRLHGVIFVGVKLVSCELRFEGEKDSVRRASTDKFSEVDSIN